jgi:uncharacterized lipoprotein
MEKETVIELCSSSGYLTGPATHCLHSQPATHRFLTDWQSRSRVSTVKGRVSDRVHGGTGANWDSPIVGGMDFRMERSVQTHVGM